MELEPSAPSTVATLSLAAAESGVLPVLRTNLCSISVQQWWLPKAHPAVAPIQPVVIIGSPSHASEHERWAL